MNRIVTVTALVLAALLSAATAFAGSGKVYVYNWTDYIPEGVLDRFTEETGIEVVYTTYDSNESMYAKLKMLDGKGYDVIVPSTYFVSKMRREGLLKKLDKSLLPNWKNLDPIYLGKSFDPESAYSVPYCHGGSGILINAERYGNPKSLSWKDLWNKDYEQQIQLQDDLREVFGMALASLGYSINDTDPAHIKEAYERLKELFPAVRTFNNDTPKTPFLNEEVTIGMIWNGEAYVAMNELDFLKFHWPEEGGIMWMDCLAIPAGAENVEEAHAFINYILRPEVAAQMVNEWGYGTANREALKLLDEKTRNNPVIFPPAEVMKKSDYQDDVGEAIVTYEKYWNKLKSGN
ncbi:ABC transporter substrate-binding protein [Salidesulfovibrio brasiliensis]